MTITRRLLLLVILLLLISAGTEFAVRYYKTAHQALAPEHLDIQPSSTTDAPALHVTAAPTPSAPTSTTGTPSNAAQGQTANPQVPAATSPSTPVPVPQPPSPAPIPTPTPPTPVAPCPPVCTGAHLCPLATNDSIRCSPVCGPLTTDGAAAIACPE